MGNRAVITTEDKQIGVYLHWNGGRDSVEGFLEVCKRYNFRPPEKDDYGWARLCQIIANYFGMGGLSVGIGPYDELDKNNRDNGVYIIKNWEIVGREYAPNQEQSYHDFESFVEAVIRKQPERPQPLDK